MNHSMIVTVEIKYNPRYILEENNYVLVVMFK